MYTQITMEGLTYKFEKLTEEINIHLQVYVENSDREAFKNNANRIVEQVIAAGGDLYMSRSCYIAHRFSFDDCKKDLLDRPQDYVFEVSDDPEEHPGIVINFK